MQAPEAESLRAKESLLLFLKNEPHDGLVECELYLQHLGLGCIDDIYRANSAHASAGVSTRTDFRLAGG